MSSGPGPPRDDHQHPNGAREDRGGANGFNQRGRGGGGGRRGGRRQGRGRGHGGEGGMRGGHADTRGRGHGHGHHWHRAEPRGPHAANANEMDQVASHPRGQGAPSRGRPHPRSHGNERGPGHSSRGGHQHGQYQDPGPHREDTQTQSFGSTSTALGLDSLRNLLQDPDPVPIMEYLQKNMDEWEQLFSAKQNTVDIDVFLIFILGEKICCSNNESRDSTPNHLVAKTLTLNFAKRIQQICKNLSVDEPEVIGRVLENLVTYCNFALETNQNRSLDLLRTVLPNLLTSVEGYRSEVMEHGELADKLRKLEEEFQDLHEIILDLAGEAIHYREPTSGQVEENNQVSQAQAKKEARIQERLSKFYFTPSEEEQMHRAEPPEDFRDLPIIPDIEEILDPEESYLRPNRQRGAYRNANHYLDVQFRLFREDFLRPLKKGIQEFMTNRHEYLSRRKRLPLGTVRLYQSVRILKASLVRDAMTYTVQLEKAMCSKIKWDRSRRLLLGNLVIFTPVSDCFRTKAYFAVVARREIDELSKAQLGIIWQGEDKPEFGQRNEEFLMFESECYFEAYRHTLQVLKDVPLDEFPMAKYIVNSRSRVDPPKYLLDTTELLRIGDQYISPLYGKWPSREDLKLDESQYSAFRNALTNEFAIVQGPPGTGKTFLGLRVMEVLLQNSRHWSQGGGPILIVCLTNYALDQFLEGILKLLRKLSPDTPDTDLGLIRVGGRTKSEEMQELSLGRRRATAAKLRLHNRDYGRRKGAAIREVRGLESDRNDLQTEYLELDITRLQGVIDVNRLSVANDLWNERPEDMNWAGDAAYFGLQHFSFETANFDPERSLRIWFNIRNARPQQPRRREVVKIDEEDDDYDLDELQANRVLDDVYFELDTKDNKGANGNPAHAPIKYIDHASVGSLQEFIKGQDRNHSKEIAQNKMKFLKRLFEYLNDGRIELPPVQDQNARYPPQTPAEAWARYLKLIELARLKLGRRLAEKESQLIEAQKSLQRIQREGDAFLLKNTKVVGMTTTGASKAADLLDNMRSKIVIVEEAAEVLEAHIINCITVHCEHLIMIGDHQQLRPNISVIELANKYHLNLSLFERMVNNKLNCFKLLVQHRMRPEISDLIRGTIYERLMDHASVERFPPVRGMVKNLFFIKHTHLESADSDSMTKTNSYEAKYLAALCKYLILQGYTPSEITILATYLGQTFEIKKELRQYSADCRSVRVAAVDNFQGEENKIILLSMVRSNKDNNIGFLKADNRICVALSRAKHGLYIVGNMDALTVTSTTWRQIRDKLAQRGELGENLQLTCRPHRTVNVIKSPSDFGKYPEGGCNLICGKKLECGHTCKSTCHEHEVSAKTKCMSRCERVCMRGHQCPGKCYVNPCKPCIVPVEKLLPCGHSMTLNCFASPESATCMEMTKKKLQPCGHHTLEPVVCHTDPWKYTCKTIVDHNLRCGHPAAPEGTLTCHETQDSARWEVARSKCKERVTRKLLCGHSLEMECSFQALRAICKVMVVKRFPQCNHEVKIECNAREERIKCGVPCPIRLDCGHQCRKLCHTNEDPDHLWYKCEKRCARSCENGHLCKFEHKCGDPCPPCTEQTEKLLACKEQKHAVKVKCNEIVSTRRCLEPCTKVLGCGHQCRNMCHERCGPCSVLVAKVIPNCQHTQELPCYQPPAPDKCNEPMKAYSKGQCGHYSMVPCRLLRSISTTESLNYCREPCKHVFPVESGGCGHKCKGTCSECLQGLIHKKCGESCGKTLICGHVCNFPCAEFCPPCNQTCNMRCDHSQCIRPCGEPCIDCCEPCTWRCAHKRCTRLCRDICDREPCNEPCPKFRRCGHPCIGLCGEPCPPLCRGCHPAQLTEFILYGYEEDDDARFVYLPDCNHCIEVEGMDYYMNHEIEEGSIVAKSCPRCKTLIRQSKRYGNVLKKRSKDIMTIKKRLFGDQTAVLPTQKAVVAEIRTFQAEAWRKHLPTYQKWLLDKLASIIAAKEFLGIRFSKEDIIYKTIDTHTFRSIELGFKHGGDAVRVLEEANIGLKVEFKTQLSAGYIKLFDRLIQRSLPLSRQEIQDFDREFGRLFDLHQLYKRRSHPNFLQQYGQSSHQVLTIYNNAEGLVGLDSRQLYTEPKKKELCSMLQELDKLFRSGLGITDREKREILSAVGMKQGHWFKCPNGHIYLITECGGAMQESTCNECGAKIGGGSHRLRNDNDIATEMDGARAAAWPTNLNR